MPTNCFRFAPRDSVSGLIAKICEYLKYHPGWSEEDLKDEIVKLVHDAGVQSFNGRTGDVVLSAEDVNNLKIANAYFGEGDETIDDLDIKALYAGGIRFVFTDFNPVTSAYNNSYVLDYFPVSDDIAYYPISTSDGGGGAVTSVNGKTGVVTIDLADVLGSSGAQVKLCTATEFTANTIETWNDYYDDGYRIVGVVNDGATAVDYLYLLKQDENNHQPIKFGSGNGTGAVDSVNGKTGVVTIDLADVLGYSGAQVKLCTVTEFTANTIETWNDYYDDGYRIVGVVNDGATAVDYLYLLKQDENNHQPIKFGSGSGTGAVDSVNGQTGVVTVGEAGVVEEESEATQYMQVFVDESQDYEPIDNVNHLNGKDAKYYIQPRNLLDNSDFTNPVNQRCIISITSAANMTYTIDRWALDSGKTLTVNDGYVTIDGGLMVQRHDQKNIDLTKTYTFACCDRDGNISVLSGKFTDSPRSNVLAMGYSSDGNIYSGIRVAGSYKWAALYEGEYTADNLPPYVHKGYAAELLECMRYYYRSWEGDLTLNADILTYGVANRWVAGANYPVPMRTARPTITLYNPHTRNSGVIGDWEDNSDITVSGVAYNNKYGFVIIVTETVSNDARYQFAFEASADL